MSPDRIKAWREKKAEPADVHQRQRLTGFKTAPHQLRLCSLSTVKQPALPFSPQHERRRAATGRRVRGAGPEERDVHGHGAVLSAWDE